MRALCSLGLPAAAAAASSAWRLPPVDFRQPPGLAPNDGFALRGVDGIVWHDGRAYVYADVVNWTNPECPSSFGSEIGVFSSADYLNWTYHGVAVPRGQPGDVDSGGTATPAALATDDAVFVSARPRRILPSPRNIRVVAAPPPRFVISTSRPRRRRDSEYPRRGRGAAATRLRDRYYAYEAGAGDGNGVRGIGVARAASPLGPFEKLAPAAPAPPDWHRPTGPGGIFDDPQVVAYRPPRPRLIRSRSRRRRGRDVDRPWTRVAAMPWLRCGSSAATASGAGMAARITSSTRGSTRTTRWAAATRSGRASSGGRRRTP